METFQGREYVIQHGEIGDKFYIIFTGSVGVLVPQAGGTWRTEVFLDAGKTLYYVKSHYSA